MKKSVIILFLIIFIILISNHNLTGNVPKKDVYVKCYDSDNGINSEETGKVTVSYSNGNIKTFEDHCYSGEYTAFKGKLREFYCNEDNSFGFKYVNCDNGCEDRRCVEKNRESFFSPGELTNNCKNRNCLIELVIEKGTYDITENQIIQFKNDLERALLGYRVEINTFDSPNKEEIKSLLKTKYENENLKLVYLIGDIPSAYFFTSGIEAIEGYEIKDTYYQDIYNTCVYNEERNAYDPKSCWGKFAVRTIPPFFVSRISPPISLECNKIAENREDIYKAIESIKNEYSGTFEVNNELLEIETLNAIGETKQETSFGCKKGYLPEISYHKEMIASFFEKNHKVRTGEITYEQKILVYAPASRFVFPSEFNNIFKYTLLNVLNYSESDIVIPNNDEEYLNDLKKNYEVLFLDAHGAPNSHQNDISSKDILFSGPKYGLFYSCSVGRFLRPNYMLGKYLFTGNMQFAQAGTIPIMTTTDIDWRTLLASQRGTFLIEISEIQKSGITNFGDPTMSIREGKKKYETSDPKILFSTKEVDLGEINKASCFEGNIIIFNAGKSPLKIYIGREILDPDTNQPLKFITANFNVWSYFENGQYWKTGPNACPPVNQELVNNAHKDNSLIYIEISPNEKFTFSFADSTPSEGPERVNSYVEIFSNDPIYPYIKLPIKYKIK